VAQHARGVSAPPDPDAPHEQPSLSYIPALDGVRAFAVLGVMAFHSAIPFLPAGFLGVDTFFVLSGFLITSLLLGEWRRLATIKLKRFWSRRARRLLPALLLVLLFVAFYAAYIVPPGTYPDLRLDALSTLFYVANWHFIAIGSNYFVETGPVSLLTHTWSLAIEEQFYLVWPLVVLVVMRVAAGKAAERYERGLWALLSVSVVGAIASAAEMAWLYHPGMNLTRLYYGTDTHAQSLLVGTTMAVVLALVAERRRQRALRPTLPGSSGAPHVGWAAYSRLAKSVIVGVGTLGLAVSAVMWWRVTYTTPFLWQGGFLVATVSTAAVLTCVVSVPRSWLSHALSVRPLRYLGRISYGMYLWHFPLFQWLDGTRTGLTGYPLFAVRCAVTIAVATASFYLVERPIRQGQLFRQWRAWAFTPVAVAGVVVAVVAATMVPAAAALPRHPVVPVADRGAPVRALLIGDSMALTLGIGISEDAKAYGVANPSDFDQAIVGCGVTVGPLVDLNGVVAPTVQPCNTSAPPVGSPLVKVTVTPYGTVSAPDAEHWTVWYKHWIKKIDPDVVMVLAGRWEVVTRVYDGKWTNILHPAFAAYVEHQLEYTIRFSSAEGAHVVLFTAPCFDTGDQPDGAPWPSDSLHRLAVYNRLVREAAAAYPTITSVLNFNELACPGEHFEEYMHGVKVRDTGSHFTVTGGLLLAPEIWPSVVKAGREALAAAHVKR